jgi:hypothetical protein
MRTLAIVALSLALTACGSKPKPATTPAPATGIQPEADEAAPDDGVTDDGPTDTKQSPVETSADPCGGGE